jgi:hypothetical protein
MPDTRLVMVCLAALPLLAAPACNRAAPAPSGPAGTDTVNIVVPIDDPTLFTRAKFDRLTYGMTRGEVEAVVGPLQNIQAAELAGPIADITWTGYAPKQGEHSNVTTAAASTGVRFAVTLRFKGDKLVGKEQQGLE